MQRISLPDDGFIGVSGLEHKTDNSLSWTEVLKN